ncbi:MAG: dihydrofolate reductase [Pyrinomonadaceae bacterium]|nr:dihydrofolate reductase [Pyrinomonadaceae bacterium]
MENEKWKMENGKCRIKNLEFKIYDLPSSISNFQFPFSIMSIIGIVAVANNFAIGKDGKLPWHYAADLKFFKETTSGNAVVMGFKTWQSIGKPLPKRLNIVLSRSRSIENQPNVLLMRSRDEVLALANYLSGDLFVIGGAATYENFADAIEKWIVTEIPDKIDDADVFMPQSFLDGFFLQNTVDLEDNLKVKIYKKLSEM